MDVKGEGCPDTAFCRGCRDLFIDCGKEQKHGVAANSMLSFLAAAGKQAPPAADGGCRKQFGAVLSWRRDPAFRKHLVKRPSADEPGAS